MGASPKLRSNQVTERSHEISNPKQKRLYTVRESAEFLGRSVWAMRELIWGGKIPVVRTDGGRKIFVDIEDLVDFINHNKSTYL